MEKKDGGFTLIELLIALAVLSIMAGVLLQSFVVSRRMNTRARKDELVLDAAKRTMEELKGYPFEELEKFLAEDGAEGGGITGGQIMIGNTMYKIERLEDDEAGGDENEEEVGGQDGALKDGRRGYRLTTDYGRDTAGTGKAKYIICAEADYGKYSSEQEEDQKRSYSINQYQMPNIADVSSFQNIVIDPQTLMKNDQLLTSQLLLKVNPDEEEENDDGIEANDDSITEHEDSNGGETEFEEKDVRRYLFLWIDETAAGEDGNGDTGSLRVHAKAVYTVDSSEGTNADDELSVEADLLAVRKNVVKEAKEVLPANRVYLFLPDENTKYTQVSEVLDEVEKNEITGFPGFDKILIHYDLEEKIEFFLVAATPEQYQEIIKDSIVTTEPSDETELLVYSNIGGNEPVSLKDAENRLYHITVTVYEADYGGTEGNPGEPEKGREILKLDSTKSE